MDTLMIYGPFDDLSRYLHLFHTSEELPHLLSLPEWFTSVVYLGCIPIFNLRTAWMTPSPEIPQSEHWGDHSLRYGCMDMGVGWWLFSPPTWIWSSLHVCKIGIAKRGNKTATPFFLRLNMPHYFMLPFLRCISDSCPPWPWRNVHPLIQKLNVRWTFCFFGPSSVIRMTSCPCHFQLDHPPLLWV